jgi:hypothetical protein
VEFIESYILQQSLYSYNPQGVQNERSVTLDEQFTNGNKLEKLDSLPPTFWQDTIFSIVTETVFDMPVLFPTEKTWKVFDKFHLPIFVSCTGFVDHVRQLGFDVFDDVINHDYDTIDDDELRIKRVLDEVRRLSKMDIGELNKIKLSLQARLKRNQDMLDYLINTSIARRDSFLNSL